MNTNSENLFSNFSGPAFKRVLANGVIGYRANECFSLSNRMISNIAAGVLKDRANANLKSMFESFLIKDLDRRAI